jgi:hypothetical protein
MFLAQCFAQQISWPVVAFAAVITAGFLGYFYMMAKL